MTTVQVIDGSVTLQQIQVALNTISSWYDTVRCAPQTPLLSAQNVFDYAHDPDCVVVLARDGTNQVCGGAIAQKSTHQVLWLFAEPGQFGAVATFLCGKAKAAGIVPWGMVGSDAVRQRFVDSGQFELVPARGPAAIRYVGA